MEAKSGSPLNTKAIENCDLEFECPMRWDALKASPNAKTDVFGWVSEKFCDKCNKTVYAVEDVAKLQEYAQLGRCVAVVQKERKVKLRGKVRAR
jgi:hypothetical protein